MRPPRCRLCGHEHWNREPHRFGRIATFGTGPTNRPSPRPATNKPTPPIDRTPSGRDREAYNAYQREYMRKRRASQRLALAQRDSGAPIRQPATPHPKAGAGGGGSPR